MADIKSVNKGNGYKYIFKKEKWKDILGKTPNRKFQKEFINILKNSPYNSYYFQTPNIRSLNDPIEFVLIKSETLHKKTADWTKYKEYMKRKPRNRTSLSFDNLSGNTKLVVPFNKKENIKYGHLKDFILNASKEEIRDILLKVGEEVENYKNNSITNEKPLFLSTHGDGVPWLHFRIESSPIYYLYKPYVKT